MEFDIKRVYSAVNADEVKVGSKVIVAKNIEALRNLVFNNMISTLTKIFPENHQDRFMSKYEYTRKTYTDNLTGSLCYLVSEPGEKKLKWTDLKVKDVIKRGKETAEVTYINEEGIDGVPNIHLWVGYIGVVHDEELAEWEKVEE